MSSKSGSASAPSSTDMGATAAAAASSFMQPKPVFGRREGKRRQQMDRIPRWCDFDQKKDFKVWADTPTRSPPARAGFPARKPNRKQKFLRLRLRLRATIVAVRASYYSTTPPAGARRRRALSMPPLPRPPQPRHRMVLAAIAVIAVIAVIAAAPYGLDGYCRTAYTLSRMSAQSCRHVGRVRGAVITTPHALRSGAGPSTNHPGSA